MINPNRTHRAKGKVIKIEPSMYGSVIVLVNGHELRGYKEWQGKDLTKGIQVGDIVNIQAQWSITGDCYLIHTINKPRARKVS